MVNHFSPHILSKVAEAPKRLYVHPRSLPLSLAPMALLFAKGYVVVGIIYFVLSHAFLILKTYQNPYFVEVLQAWFSYRGRCYHA